MSKRMENLPKVLVIGVLVLGAGSIASRMLVTKSDAAAGGVRVIIPARLSAKAQVGKVAFDANCGQCHGANAAGTGNGPPFVHPIYNPGHHPDAAFFQAAHQGVPQHHWNFGDMPAQPQVGDADLDAIVAYVRELQHANGIFYQEHRM
ncbi:MAG: cytochrome c [Azospirillaceae bacterium]|nr:cytochrome c [Azospirillaceae bacterium]